MGSRWAPDELGLALGATRLTAKTLLARAERLTRLFPATLAAWRAGRLDEARVLDLLEVTAVLPDGMGSLWARLSAVDTEAVWQTLCRLAKALGPDDPRSMDQRRADLLVDLCTGRLTLTDTTAVTEQVNAALAHLRDAVNADTDTDIDDTAAARSSTGDADASGAQTGATAQADVAANPAEAADGSGESPSPGQRPGEENANPLGGAAMAFSEAQLAAAVEAVLAHRPDPRAAGRGKPLIQVVVGYDTLTGTTDTPAELVGYRPIPAGLAREAAADGVWKRLVTDPPTGALLDHGRTVYRPPAALRDFVVARDQTCRFPTCNRRAMDGDLDHHQRAADHGPTCERNLHGLCKHHHVLKEHGDWQVLAHPDGTLTWTTPTGHRYVSRPYDYRPFTTATSTPDAEPPMPDPDAAAEVAARAHLDTETNTDQPGDTPPPAPRGGWTLASMRGETFPADLDDPAPFWPPARYRSNRSCAKSAAVRLSTRSRTTASDTRPRDKGRRPALDRHLSPGNGECGTRSVYPGATSERCPDVHFGQVRRASCVVTHRGRADERASARPRGDLGSPGPGRSRGS